jgi:thiamine-phosphate pyrophosphorylase
MPGCNARLRGVYAVTDTVSASGDRLVSAVEQAIRGGARLIQYRDKTGPATRRRRQADALQALCARFQIPLIVNDDVELARACGAAGVHLGKDDADPRQARQALGKNSIIGVSCYNDLSRARQAQNDGADYLAFGSVYPSPSKPQAVRVSVELLRQAREELSIPICAIGGITAANAKPLVDIGIDMLAVISGIFADQDITAATRALADLY